MIRWKKIYVAPEFARLVKVRAAMEDKPIIDFTKDLADKMEESIQKDNEKKKRLFDFKI